MSEWGGRKVSMGHWHEMGSYERWYWDNARAVGHYVNPLRGRAHEMTQEQLNALAIKLCEWCRRPSTSVLDFMELHGKRYTVCMACQEKYIRLTQPKPPEPPPESSICGMCEMRQHNHGTCERLGYGGFRQGGYLCKDCNYLVNYPATWETDQRIARADLEELFPPIKRPLWLRVLRWLAKL
jgi:hypothetical protein